MNTDTRMRLRLISWNIDGVKAHFESLTKIVERYSPDIICLQKYKDNKASAEFEIKGYTRHVSAAPYAGVATYVKEYLSPQPVYIENDTVFAGHLLPLAFELPAFTLFNVYTPFSNPSVNGAVEHRMLFDAALTELASSTGGRMILCGDFNIVHTAQDCWDLKHRRNKANFHDWERVNFNRLLVRCNLIDTYRHFNADGNAFSYFWRNDKDLREKNRGFRIDYFLASESFEPQITRAEILRDTTASTNNPILLELEPVP